MYKVLFPHCHTNEAAVYEHDTSPGTSQPTPGPVSRLGDRHDDLLEVFLPAHQALKIGNLQTKLLELLNLMPEGGSRNDVSRCVLFPSVYGQLKITLQIRMHRTLFSKCGSTIL